jgi:hypothetical protein
VETTVAGSLPLDVRTQLEVGDYEQGDADLYALASYEDLYILGAVGPGRGQVQILNEYDACCFWTANRSAETFAYVGAVNQRAGALGGSWRLWIDQGQRGHTISDASIDTILTDLGASPLPTPTPSPTWTPTPTATPTPTGTSTPTPISTAVPGPCKARPPVRVTVVAIPGGIHVTATAASPISDVTFGQVRNAAVSPVTIVGGVATFTATRLGPGSIHVPFMVTDACGPWQTFAGLGS